MLDFALSNRRGLAHKAERLDGSLVSPTSVR